MRTAFLLGAILALSTCYEDSLGALQQIKQLERQRYCTGCGAKDEDCCIFVNCFNPEGWDGGCNSTEQEPLQCNRNAPSTNGQGKCEPSTLTCPVPP